MGWAGIRIKTQGVMRNSSPLGSVYTMVVWRIDKKGRFYHYVRKKGEIVRFYAKDNQLPDDYADIIIADSSIFMDPK